MFGRSSLPDSPFPLFAQWMEDARQCAEIRYPGAVFLSTISPEGYPEGRIVLLHDFDATGFFVMTDVRSDKGKAMASTPRAALTFYWEPLERQVRIQGEVEPASETNADRFFEERPRRSRATAWASEQSIPLPDPAILAGRMAHFDAEFADIDPIPRPQHWRAFRIVPRFVEFWQAGARRLHERFRYAREDVGWNGVLLAP